MKTPEEWTDILLGQLPSPIEDAIIESKGSDRITSTMADVFRSAIAEAAAAERVRTTRIIAAYMLDRADQYKTSSPCWIALADVASDVMNGEAEAAEQHGELDADLMKRVDGMSIRARGGKP